MLKLETTSSNHHHPTTRKTELFSYVLPLQKWTHSALQRWVEEKVQQSTTVAISHKTRHESYNKVITWLNECMWWLYAPTICCQVTYSAYDLCRIQFGQQENDQSLHYITADGTALQNVMSIKTNHHRKQLHLREDNIQELKCAHFTMPL